jgi:hypothetical protein
MNTQKKRTPVAINPAACDRCHGQKLRCDRGTPESSSSLNTTVTTFKACLRCVRAHATCITTSRRRTGRPRIGEREISGSQSRPGTSSGQLPSHSGVQNEIVHFNDLHLTGERGSIVGNEESSDLARLETPSLHTGNGVWSLPSFESLQLFVPPNLSFQAHSQLNSLSHCQPADDERPSSSPIHLQQGASFQHIEVTEAGGIEEIAISPTINLDQRASGHQIADSETTRDIDTTESHEEAQTASNSSSDFTFNDDFDSSPPVAKSTSTNNTTTFSSPPSSQKASALPPDSRSALHTLCITKLSSLTSDSLMDVDTLNRGQLCAVLCASNEQPGKVAIVMDRIEEGHYSIGKLLLSCQRLLEVLRGVDFLSPTFRTEWDVSSSFFPRNADADDTHGVEEDESVQTNNLQPGGRSQLPLPSRSLGRRDASKLEFSTILALLSSYSSLIQCCSLILSCIFASLLDHASSTTTISRLSPAGDLQTIEIETLYRAIWRMVTHMELRLLAMASSDFQGSEGIGREFWDAAMPHLGNRREGRKRKGKEESLNQMIKEITILSHSIKC